MIPTDDLLGNPSINQFIRVNLSVTACPTDTENDVLCAGTKSNIADVCSGDHGSGLFTKTGQR